MKFLPCKNCRTFALATKDGVRHAIGTVHDPVIVFLCRRCGRNTSLTAAEIALLPDLSDADAEAHYAAERKRYTGDRAIAVVTIPLVPNQR